MMEETALTVNFKLGLVTPERTAVMLVVPLPSPVTAPFAKIAATDEFELVQVTLEVMSAVVRQYMSRQRLTVVMHPPQIRGESRSYYDRS